MHVRELLTAVQARVREALDYVRDTDVFVTPDVDFIPHGVRLPAVAIKDGPVQVREQIAGLEERVMRVGLVVWVDLADPEATVMGASAERGVLAVAADVVDALRDQTLGLSGVILARPVAESESELAADDSRAASRKAITMEYTWEGTP